MFACNFPRNITNTYALGTTQETGEEVPDKKSILVFAFDRNIQVSKPWIARGIRTSIKRKYRLFASGDNTRYKQYRLCF